MIIAITGTPGTGKTVLAERLAKKLGYDLVKVNELAREKGLVLEHDKKRDSDIIDTNALSKINLTGNMIVEGHLAHYTKFDIAIVLRCDPKELYRRLRKRGYAKDKIRENLESECLGILLSESLSRSNKVYEIDTTKRTITDTLRAAIDVIEGKRNKYKPKIDYLEKITELDNIIK